MRLEHLEEGDGADVLNVRLQFGPAQEEEPLLFRGQVEPGLGEKRNLFSFKEPE